MDYITVGLDFGTHQTKICVQIVPDEGRGQPRYEFFTFKDLLGNSHYFLPSYVKIKKDNTLLYGYDEDSHKEIKQTAESAQSGSKITNKAKSIAINVGDTAKNLFSKYVVRENKEKGMDALIKMLQIRKRQIEAKERKIEEEQLQLESTKETLQIEEVFRYFKQATFAGARWVHSIDYTIVSIWYLSYVLFLLEEKYGQNFSINMGVPADSVNYKAKKQKAVELLLNAYNLVEDIYQNDKEAFLSETVDGLMQNTPSIKYTESLQEEYNIKVFPEAYAGLVTLTEQRKLTHGMCMYVDIGGGTTDFSFFSIPMEGDKIMKYPMIFRYWSINQGLNYLAEASGFNYSEGNFESRIKPEVISSFKMHLSQNAKHLEDMIHEQFLNNTDVDKKYYNQAMRNRIVVYNGGGSTYPFLTSGLGNFSTSKVIESSLWKNVTIADKNNVEKLCPLLTTAYGLSLGKNESDVKLTPFHMLFYGHKSELTPSTHSTYGGDENEDRTPRGNWV